MGNNGRKILNDVLKKWDLEYEERKSLTNEDSFILNIKKIKKKFHENNFNNKSKGWSRKNNNSN